MPIKLNVLGGVVDTVPAMSSGTVDSKTISPFCATIVLSSVVDSPRQ